MLLRSLCAMAFFGLTEGECPICFQPATPRDRLEVRFECQMPHGICARCIPRVDRCPVCLALLFCCWNLIVILINHVEQRNHWMIIGSLLVGGGRVSCSIRPKKSASLKEETIAERGFCQTGPVLVTSAINETGLVTIGALLSIFGNYCS